MTNGNYTLPPDTGLSIGLRFHDGYFFKWSNQLNAWGMVDDVAAIAAVQTITGAVAALPFTLALSAALNIQGGSNATH